MLKKWTLALCSLSSICFAHNLSLQDAESEALARNFALKQSYEAYQIGKQERREAISAYLPSLEYNATRTQLSSPGAIFSYKKLYSSDFSLKQEILSTERFFQIGVTKAAREALLYQHYDMGNRILTEVRKAYYRVVLETERLAIQQEEVHVLSASVRDAELLNQEGYNTDFDLLQSQVALAEATADYYKVLKSLKQAKIDLQELLGGQMDQFHLLVIEDKALDLHKTQDLEEMTLGVERALEEQGIQLTSLNMGIFEDLEALFMKGFLPYSMKQQWMDEALKKNPEVTASDFRVKKARKALWQNIGTYLPAVSSQVDYIGPAGTASSFSSLKYHWEFGLRFTWKLFDSLGREFRVAQGRHKLKQEKAYYQELENKLTASVENQFTSLEEAILRYLVAKEGVRLAKINAEQAQLRKKEGMIRNLDYLEVIRAQKKVQFVYTEALYNLFSAYFDLKRDTGANLPDLMAKGI